MKKVISFSLWGEDPKYCTGAIRNAELAKDIYPGWVCRFYISGNGNRVEGPSQPIGVLSNTVRMLVEMDHVEITTIPANMGGWKGMFARFLPTSDPEVDVTISRDCDSRLSQREAEAVEDWLCGPKLIHAMRDHPHHNTAIMGGMWGAKKGAIPDMDHLLARYLENKKNADYWQVDQDFLRDLVWPKYYHKVLAHDDWDRYRHPSIETKPFPSERKDKEFVGSIIGPNEERLHHEHHEMV